MKNIRELLSFLVLLQIVVCVLSMPFTLEIVVGDNDGVGGQSEGLGVQLRQGQVAGEQLRREQLKRDLMALAISPGSLNIPQGDIQACPQSSLQSFSRSGKESQLLFIAVFSAPFRFAHRTSVRQGLFQSFPHFTRGISGKFFIGLPDLAGASLLDLQRLSLELQTYDDILLLAEPDGYRRITFKHKYIYEYFLGLNVQYLMKLDDDVYLNLGALLDFLSGKAKYDSVSEQVNSELDPVSELGPVSDPVEMNTLLLYMGLLMTGQRPFRDATSKYYLSEGEYARPTFPPFASGTGYILSVPLVDMLLPYASGRMGDGWILPLEDISVALWIEDLQSKLMKNETSKLTKNETSKLMKKGTSKLMKNETLGSNNKGISYIHLPDCLPEWFVFGVPASKFSNKETSDRACSRRASGGSTSDSGGARSDSGGARSDSGGLLHFGHPLTPQEMTLLYSKSK